MHLTSCTSAVLAQWDLVISSWWLPCNAGNRVWVVTIMLWPIAEVGSKSVWFSGGGGDVEIMVQVDEVIALVCESVKLVFL